LHNGIGIYLPNQLITKRISTLGTGNRVYYNNFIDNNRSALVDNAYSYYPPDLNGTNTLGNGTDIVSWDNGNVGNYWSDQNSHGSYVIDQNNVDHYPLNQQAVISSTAPIQTNAVLTLPIAVIVVVLAVAVSLLLYRRHRKPNLLSK
jgi:hypothetical protein